MCVLKTHKNARFKKSVVESARRQDKAGSNKIPHKRAEMVTLEFFTTRQAAKILLVDIGKVGDFIASGDLLAVNVAKNSGGIRPRWRISREALDAFLAARQTHQPTPAPRRRRQKEVANYY
jgi:hypothetical protein